MFPTNSGINGRFVHAFLFSRLESNTNWTYLNKLQSTDRSEKYPTQTTEPTLQCVVDIGRPALLATNTVSAAPNSIVNPLYKQTLI